MGLREQFGQRDGPRLMILLRLRCDQWRRLFRAVRIAFRERRVITHRQAQGRKTARGDRGREFNVATVGCWPGIKRDSLIARLLRQKKKGDNQANQNDSKEQQSRAHSGPDPSLSRAQRGAVCLEFQQVRQ